MPNHGLGADWVRNDAALPINAFSSKSRISADDLLHHVPHHVHQSHAAACVAVCQFLVIEAEQVHDGRVPVVNVNLPSTAS